MAVVQECQGGLEAVLDEAEVSAAAADDLLRLGGLITDPLLLFT